MTNSPTDSPDPFLAAVVQEAEGRVREDGFEIPLSSYSAGNWLLHCVADLSIDILHLTGFTDADVRLWNVPRLQCDVPSWLRSEGFVEFSPFGAEDTIHLPEVFSLWSLANLLAFSVSPSRPPQDPARIALTGSFLGVMAGEAVGGAYRAAAAKHSAAEG